MPNFGTNVNVRDWCVEIETLPYTVDDSGTSQPSNVKKVKRVRIEECSDEYSEDLHTGERSLTLLHQGRALTTFSSEPSADGSVNTLNGSNDFGYIVSYFENEFYQLRVRA